MGLIRFGAQDYPLGIGNGVAEAGQGNISQVPLGRGTASSQSSMSGCLASTDFAWKWSLSHSRSSFACSSVCTVVFSPY